MLGHPNVSLWHREEDGSYHAELEGWKLQVKWVPPAGGAPFGFTWSAEGPDTTHKAPEPVEEAEIAMLQAETATRPAPHA
jgi:hypothetical protein